MKKFIHIRCKIPTTISINGEKINNNNPDIVCNGDFYIAFFPVPTSKYLPCAISTYGEIYPESIKKIPFKNNHYEIIYDPLALPDKINGLSILNKKYGNFIFSIVNSNKSYISITSSSFSHSSVSDKLINVNFKSNDGYVIISGTIEDGKNYLLIFNTKSKKILIESIFKQIETTKSEIKALKESKNILGYGTVYNFNFSTKKLNKYHVHTRSTNISSQPEIIPLQFLEALKYKDYKHAITFLENPNVSPSQLETFFGEIEEIYFNGYSNETNYTILTTKKYKNFTFNVINNKIVDIEENPL